MNNQTSELIRALRLLLIMGLVLIHFGSFPGSSLNPFQGVVNPEYFASASINSFFLYFFLSSVPILSIISGYLFSYKGEPDYKNAFKKRILTLVLPSIAWTTIWLMFAFSLYSLGHNGTESAYYDSVFNNFSILKLLNGIIGVTDSPFAFQFWFIHDLVLSIMLTPILFPLIKRAPFLILGLFIVWAIEWEVPIFFNLKVLTFFCVGIFLGQRSWVPPTPNTLTNASIFIYIALVLGRIYTPYFCDGLMPFETIYELILRSTGTIAILNIVINIREKTPRIFAWLSHNSSLSFFIFATHFPIIVLCKQALHTTNQFTGNFGEISLWIISPVLTVSFIFVAAKILNKILPSLYKFLNGQRSI